MSYTQYPIRANYQDPTDTPPQVVFPSSFRCFLLSIWFDMFAGAGSAGVQAGCWGSTGTGDIPNFGAFLGLRVQVEPTSSGPPFVLNVSAGDGILHGGGPPGSNLYIGTAAFDFSTQAVGTLYNMLISIDTVAQTVQCYINDTALSALTPAEWQTSAPMAASRGGNTIQTAFCAEPNFLTPPCMADVWMDASDTFFDLSVSANRRKFINADLTPVDLGTNGQIPLGTPPVAFFTQRTGFSIADFKINQGSAGGSVASFSSFPTYCGSAPPAGGGADVADLFFSAVDGFVDLTVESNRRAFITDIGGDRDLGADGSAPYGVRPVVYLSRRGAASTFQTNLGRGGAFAATGTAPVAAGSDPPGSTVSVTTTLPGTVGQGVLGDYRNGNIYAFNPATLTDNGTQRKWVRIWRALPQATNEAISFKWLTVDMQTGINVPEGTTPRVMLRWSDDGGYSWSDYRILSAGQKGATSQTIKFNRLGMTRRYSGSDRIFELSSTDPFAVAIMGADVNIG